MINILALVGAIGVGSFLCWLAFLLGSEIGRVHRVGKQYEKVLDKVWYREDLFEHQNEHIESLLARLSLAERNLTNLRYEYNEHYIQAHIPKTTPKRRKKAGKK